MNKRVEELMAKRKVKSGTKTHPKSYLPTVYFEGKEYTLTMKQYEFCHAYLDCKGNARQASSGIYNDLKHAYNTLKLPHIQIYIGQLMDAAGWNLPSVAMEHMELIRQNNSLNAKARGIDMFYKVHGNYAPTKSEVTQVRVTEERKQYIDQLLDE